LTFIEVFYVNVSTSMTKGLDRHSVRQIIAYLVVCEKPCTWIGKTKSIGLCSAVM